MGGVGAFDGSGDGTDGRDFGRRSVGPGKFNRGTKTGGEASEEAGGPGGTVGGSEGMEYVLV